MSFIKIGVVEDRLDPLELGRVRVRIYSYHTEDKQVLPTEDLPWSPVGGSVYSGSISGIGQSPTGIVPGTTVYGTFLDDYDQQFLVMGTLYGISMTKSAQTISELTGGVVFTDGDGLLDSTIGIVGSALDLMMDSSAADNLGLSSDEQSNETHLNFYKLVQVPVTELDTIYEIRMTSDLDNSGVVYFTGKFDTTLNMFIFYMNEPSKWDNVDSQMFSNINPSDPSDAKKYMYFPYSENPPLVDANIEKDTALNFFDTNLPPNKMLQGVE
jgi:hypothetical protein